MEMGIWGGSKVLLVSHIFWVIPTITFFDTSEGSVKSVRMMSMRRWLNGDGWVGGEVGKSIKNVPNISNFQYYYYF